VKGDPYRRMAIPFPESATEMTNTEDASL
jgi:hypothetical protein